MTDTVPSVLTAEEIVAMPATHLSFREERLLATIAAKDREIAELGAAVASDHCALVIAECLLQRIAVIAAFTPEPPREDSPNEVDVYVGRCGALPQHVADRVTSLESKLREAEERNACLERELFDAESLARELPRSWLSMVHSWHEKFGVPIGNSPAIRRPELRAALIEEEARETCEAIRRGDLVEAIDGMCDVIYVICGTAIEFGLDLHPFFAEVHRTNMAKDGGSTRSDGKILKPEGWQPPRIAELLAALQDAKEQS